MRKENEEEVRRMQSDANAVKSRLIDYYCRLRDMGENELADRLDTVIIKLEVWQHRN